MPTQCAAAELGALTVPACQSVRGALFQSLDIKSQASSQKLLSTEPWLKPCRAPSKPTPHGSEPWKGWVDPPLLFPSLTPLGYTVFGPCGKTHYFSSLLGTECGFTTCPEGVRAHAAYPVSGGGSPPEMAPKTSLKIEHVFVAFLFHFGAKKAPKMSSNV